MCLKTKTPPQPKQTPVPQTDENATAVVDARKKAASAQGVFANIFTSALGDASFDTTTKKNTASPATLTI